MLKGMAIHYRSVFHQTLKKIQSVMSRKQKKIRKNIIVISKHEHEKVVMV